MDGNRRWARSRACRRPTGTGAAPRRCAAPSRAAGKEGVRYLTLFAFSSENWRRPASEVGDLMDLLRLYFRREINELCRNGVRLRVIGDRAGLARDIRRPDRRGRGRRAATTTARSCRGAELWRPARDRPRPRAGSPSEAQAGSSSPHEIDEQLFGAHLITAGIPDPDLLIRTSGEQRISNFLLWQLAYTEFVFVPVSWPDFTEEHLRDALREYPRRDRRYGASAG